MDDDDNGATNAFINAGTGTITLENNNGPNDFGGDITILADGTFAIADRTGTVFLVDPNLTPPAITATIPVTGWTGEARSSLRLIACVP